MMSEPPTCLIPQNALTPFDCWSLPDEENKIFLHPELNIPVEGLTLVTGEGDLTALAFDIACRCMNLNLGKLLYLRSDNFPEHSPFPAFLTKCLPAPWGVINIKFSTDLQYWPLDLSGIPPQRNFMWLVMSSKKMIWKRWPYATSNTRSSLEANLDLCAKAGNKFTSPAKKRNKIKRVANK